MSFVTCWKSLKGEDVSQELDNISLCEGLVPERIQCDNGSEFISKEVDRWTYENKVTLDFSRPGKPTDNPYVESFNGKFRDECLSTNWFLDMEDAKNKSKTGDWSIIISGHIAPWMIYLPKNLLNCMKIRPKLNLRMLGLQ